MPLTQTPKHINTLTQMIQAFIHFTRGLFKMPVYAQLWLVLLVIVNGIVPLFFLGRVEAQATLGIFLAGALLMIALTALSGFSRLLGAGHFLWFILLGLLWTRLDQLPADDLFNGRTCGSRSSRGSLAILEDGVDGDRRSEDGPEEHVVDHEAEAAEKPEPLPGVKQPS